VEKATLKGGKSSFEAKDGQCACPEGLSGPFRTRRGNQKESREFLEAKERRGKMCFAAGEEVPTFRCQIA